MQHKNLCLLINTYIVLKRLHHSKLSRAYSDIRTTKLSMTSCK